MTGHITRTLLFMMMLLTGLSAAEVARADDTQRLASEELSLTSSVDVVASASSLFSQPSLRTHAETQARLRHVMPTEYLLPLSAYMFSTPQTRHDIARE